MSQTVSEAHFQGSASYRVGIGSVYRLKFAIQTTVFWGLARLEATPLSFQFDPEVSCPCCSAPCWHGISYRLACLSMLDTLLSLRLRCTLEVFLVKPFDLPFTSSSCTEEQNDRIARKSLSLKGAERGLSYIAVSDIAVPGYREPGLSLSSCPSVSDSHFVFALGGFRRKNYRTDLPGTSSGRKPSCFRRNNLKTETTSNMTTTTTTKTTASSRSQHFAHLES